MILRKKSGGTMKHILTSVLGGVPMFAQEKNSKKMALTILLKICRNIGESDDFKKKIPRDHETYPHRCFGG